MGARTRAGAYRAGAVRVASLSLLLVAVGCAPYPGYFERGVRIATKTTEVPNGEALILPEPGAAPRVIAVLQTAYSNAVHQEIILETNSSARGQNAFYATFFGPVEHVRAGDNARSDEFLNEEDLEKEMEEHMPGVSMYTSNYFVQNRYGPFNYAMGRGAPGEICMYAWQRIHSQVPVYRFFARDRGVLSIRLRLCQRGASEQDLLRVMYRYSINAYFLPRGWQPYGRPMGEPEGMGRIGGPLAYPSGVQGDGTVLDGWMGAEPRAAAAPRPARRYGSAVPAPEPVEPAPSAPSYDPQTDGYTPAGNYPVVPAPASAAQAAPGATPNVIPGLAPSGSTVTPAPARPVQTEGQTSPFSPTPHPQSVVPAAPSPVVPGSNGAAGTPVRLIPGTSGAANSTSTQ